MRRAIVAIAITTAAWANEARAQETCASAYERGQELKVRRELVRAQAELRMCERSCPTRLATDCSTWRQEVERAIATVLLQATSEKGAALPNVRVSEHGMPIGAANGEAVPLDPGSHHLTFEDERGVHVEVDVKLAEGERNKVVAVRFPAPVIAPPPPTTPPKVPPPRPRSNWAYVLGGAGFVGIAVGSVLGIKGQVERSNLDSGCGQTGTCDKKEVNAIAREWTAGAIATGVGAALLASGVIVWVVTTPKASPRATSTTIAVRPGLSAIALDVAF
jgi:hypothetical protein